ncbi:hypothetical protein [Rhodovulum sp. MB263]|uniref:hypothetical protein n=1 Tax=Rhodovulum sp. (strain MB263) TaxID=308754 RepID=UPI0009B742EE|nr:hypothetical protein [Rhodovulum sp. MB263]ARC89153.1 hypothetical protein B5V46_11305 [Rhodovulum sp. MB263]
MRGVLLPLSLGLAAVMAPFALAQETDDAALMAEAAWDWRPGDLIFRDGLNESDGVIKRAFGLRWESVGILRPSSGGPRVVYVDPSEGVTEEMLYVYVDGLSARDYAVYRVREAGREQARPGQMNAAQMNTAQMETGQMNTGALAQPALTVFYGAPSDDGLMLGDGAFYSAELVYEAALNAGIVLGAPIRLSDLAANPDDLDRGLRARLEDHRYCRYELSFEACWANSLGQHAIVTTGSLIGSGMLERVFP